MSVACSLSKMLVTHRSTSRCLRSARAFIRTASTTIDGMAPSLLELAFPFPLLSQSGANSSSRHDRCKLRGLSSMGRGTYLEAWLVAVTGACTRPSSSSST